MSADTGSHHRSQETDCSFPRAPALRPAPLAATGPLPITVVCLSENVGSVQSQLVAFATAFSSGPLLIEADTPPLGHLHYFLVHPVCAGLEELKR